MARRAWGFDDRPIGPTTWKKAQALGLYEVSEPLGDLDDPEGTWDVVRSKYDNGFVGVRSHGGYIRWLIHHGIRPELAHPDHGSCSVGRAKNGKWVGWSHRAASYFDTRDEAVEFAASVD